MRAFNLFTVAVCVLPTACAVATEGDEPVGTVEQREVWSTSDDPAIFTASLDRKLDSLPLTGEAAVIPWAGSYWPTYKDNINYRWDGASSDSPAKKYEKAFGGTNVEDKVSTYHGIDSRASAKTCTADTECNKDLGEKCAKRTGKTSGKCIPTWYGICHAWTPAAILLPEPKVPVTKNGVTFKINDLKALGSLVFNSTTSKFVSLRCNKTNKDNGITYDANGRPSSTNAECRDTNPGTYHLLLTNYLGKKKQAIAEDRTFDSEVWNQPIRGYRVTSQKTVTLSEALSALEVAPTGGTTTNKSLTVTKGQWSTVGTFTVTAGSQYRVAMTGTGDADLYVHFGSSPTASSYTCRPYGETSAETCSGVVPAGATKMYVSVNGYSDSSTAAVATTVGGTLPTTYPFNANAKSLVLVKTEVDYISESEPETDGNLSSQIAQYTRTDRYDYVLELDSSGNIIGGEWVGASKQAHPDFVWLPIAAGTTSVAGGAITYAQVKALLDESVATTSTSTSTSKTVTQSGSVAAGEWKTFGPYSAAAATNFVATMTGTGDADLYVRKGAAPTLSAYDCRPYSGTSNETCTVAGPGSFYVGVNGYSASTYSLNITYTAP